MKSNNRKRDHKIIGVRVTEEESNKITENAKNTGLHPASMLRKLGCGYKPHSTIDVQHILSMLRVNGDLGRLGGLLKLWLTDDQKVKHFQKRDIDALLNRIVSLQDDLVEVITRLDNT